MQNIWVFQANPDDYDLTKEVIPGRVDDWQISRFRNEVGADDTAILWQSEGTKNRKNPGIYGLGKLGSAIGADRINIEYFKRLDRPVLKSALLDDPVVRDMAVIRYPFQANPFKLTANEWSALKIHLAV